MQNQVWWYFKFNEKGGLYLADKSDFKNRPSDANPDQGNPYTPWHQTDDHYDEHHIHIKAINYSEAFKKAKQIQRKSKVV